MKQHWHEDWEPRTPTIDVVQVRSLRERLDETQEGQSSQDTPPAGPHTGSQVQLAEMLVQAVRSVSMA